MKIKKIKLRKKLLGFVCILLSIIILALSIFFNMRPVIITHAESTAKTLLINSANQAVVNILDDNEITYNNIVNIIRNNDGFVTSVSIDIVKLNLIKSKISLEIPKVISQQDIYTIFIPVGTFLGNEFTNGLGPRIKFNMQVTSTTIVNFQQEFNEAGINQVNHRIILTIDIYGKLVIRGITDNMIVSTTAIIAETVIVGITPDAFTEVIESPYSDSAEIINDYGTNQ